MLLESVFKGQSLSIRTNSVILAMAFCKKNKTPHPRDGSWAWLVCFAGTMAFGLLFGYLLSFGVFLPVLRKHFNSSRGNTALIGSLAIGFSYLFGPLAVKTIDLVNERTVGVCGALVASSLMAISSFVNHIIILYLLHGVLLGLCASFILNSLLLIIRKYFKEKLAVAIGIASSGSSLGVLCIGPGLHFLIDLLGWRGTFRVMSGVFVVVALLSLTYDPNIQVDNETSIITLNGNMQSQSRCQGFCSIWKSRRYVVGIITIFMVFFGMLVPSIHLVKFAEDLDIPSSKSSLLFIYIGVCSTIIRLVIGKVIQKRWLTPLQGVQFSAFTVGFSTILFTQATAYYHFIIFAVFYGIGSGAFTTTLALFFLTCFDDLSKASLSLSTGLTVSSIALFTGAPAGGFIADQFQSYIPAFYICGGLVTIAGILPFCLLCGSQTNEEHEVMDIKQLRMIGYRLATVDSDKRYSTYIDEGARV